MFFSTPRSGCGGFDYNCDGQLTEFCSWSTTNLSCDRSCVALSAERPFSAAECGRPANYSYRHIDNGNCRGDFTSTRVNASCR